jgi:hypothetical protein
VIFSSSARASVSMPKISSAFSFSNGSIETYTF